METIVCVKPKHFLLCDLVQDHSTLKMYIIDNVMSIRHSTYWTYKEAFLYSKSKEKRVWHLKL